MFSSNQRRISKWRVLLISIGASAWCQPAIDGSKLGVPIYSIGAEHDFNVVGENAGPASKNYDYGPNASPAYFVFQWLPGMGGGSARVEVLSTDAKVLWEGIATTAGGIWTPEMPPKGQIRVTRIQGAGGVLHQEKAITDPPKPNRPQQLTHGNEKYLEPLTEKSQRLKDYGRWIARLSWIKDTLQFRCTGFLIGPKLLVSNHHCLVKQPDITKVIVEFNKNKQSDVSLSVGIQRVALAAPAIDVVIYELNAAVPTLATNPFKADSNPNTQIRQWMISGTGEELKTSMVKKQTLALIQHPNGKPKKVSLLDCQITHPEPNARSNGLLDFGHFCDTEWGSSGSPVLDFHTGKVVGIHFTGFGEGVTPSKDDPLRVNRAIQIHELYKQMMGSKDPMLVTTAGERIQPLQ